ncbi:hypothetical protein CAI21_11625 [Alkalilimnicola ehrlichii]|uniref:hypothetical protein n=1 Tax=Alkalilimnicola ehrlichii TaxID=351052 RepID=UPI000E2F2576|nr:hypothetical protein [Alkalilimnicola ehrlichii]RFA28518.1 hypothetical protein CAI21_11625 [Alkalilimnicola ehrlichii]
MRKATSEQSDDNKLDELSLARLGLDQQPFIDSDFIFADASYSTQVNVGLQLLHAGDHVVAVRGEEGVGKSTFCVP